MTAHTPFAVRILAEVARMAAWPVRGFLAAVGADPMPALAFGVLLIVVTLSLAPALKTLLVAERWITRHLAAHRARHDGESGEFDQIVARLHADYPDLYETVRRLPGRTREIKRRRMPGVRIPRRVMRHTSTADSDRRH